MMLYGLVGAAGLTAGMWQSWPGRRDRSDKTVRRGAGVLVALSAMLVLLAPPPPTSDAPMPCLQIHHCVITPHRPDVVDPVASAPGQPANADTAVLLR